MRLIVLLLLTIALISFASAVCNEGQIDINTATLEELDQLYGIGPVYAQNIINERPFNNIDELINVKGIGEKTLTEIKSQGLACVENEKESNNEEENTPEEDNTAGDNQDRETILDEEENSNDNPNEVIKKTFNITGNIAIESNITFNLEPISLNSPAKDIKSEENSEFLSKNRIAMYGFFVFSVVIVILLVIRRKKIYENDFR